MTAIAFLGVVVALTGTKLLRARQPEPGELAVEAGRAPEAQPEREAA